MTTRDSRRGLVLALWLPLVAGCDVLSPPPVVSVPQFAIPSPRPPKRTKSVDDAFAVFPDPAQVTRDPFLTAAEQDALEHGTPVKEEIPVVAPPPVAGKKKDKPKPVPQLETVELELSTLFTSRDGRRHAVARDRKTGRDIQIDEGQVLGEFEVTSISDDAIRVKELKGPIVRVFPFRRAAAETPWLMKNH